MSVACIAHPVWTPRSYERVNLRQFSRCISAASRSRSCLEAARPLWALYSSQVGQPDSWATSVSGVNSHGPINSSRVAFATLSLLAHPAPLLGPPALGPDEPSCLPSCPLALSRLCHLALSCLCHLAL